MRPQIFVELLNDLQSQFVFLFMCRLRLFPYFVLNCYQIQKFIKEESFEHLYFIIIKGALPFFFRALTTL